jgi:hypothetical protein
LVSYLVPALLAYGKFFAFYFNVQFDVFVFAVVFPWVFTMLHVSCLGMPLLVSSAFKAAAETTSWSRGGVSESETINFFVMKEGWFIAFCLGFFVCARNGTV